MKVTFRQWRTAASLLTCGLSLSSCGGCHRSDQQPEADECPRDELSGNVLTCARLGVDAKAFLAAGAKVKLELPDGSPLELTAVEVQPFEGKGIVWHGAIVDKKFSDVTIATVGKAVAGTIAFDGRMFRLRTVSDTVLVIEELNPADFPNDIPAGPARVEQVEVEPPTLSCSPGTDDCQPLLAQCTGEDPDIIDILVIYTGLAEQALQGEDALNAWTILQVFQANRSYALSKLSHRIRLVSVQRTSYHEQASNNDSLEVLIGDLSAELNAHALRNDTYADVVVLLAKSASAGSEGNARTMKEENLPLKADGTPKPAFIPFEPYAYAVVDAVGVATPEFTLAHEIGHLLGAQHDLAADPGQGVIPDTSRGYVNLSPGPDCNPFLTIMAVRETPQQQASALAKIPDRLPFWSNASLGQCGLPAGSDTANNRDSLKLSAPFVAKFRCGLPSPGKVWMKDTWNDNGTEPDPAQAGMDMWKSPYIWVRNEPDSGPSFPEQHLNQSPLPGQVNYVYAKLQNDGDEAEGKLQLWVADAATTLVWPASFELKDEIPVPDLAAHGPRIADPLKWTPPGTGPYSLLVRWVSAADAIPTPEPVSVDALVRGSNNVVWRTVGVVTLASGGESAPLPVAVDNLGQDRSLNNFLIKPTDANPAYSYFRHGEIVAQLGDGLMRAWERTGYGGTGFERSGNRIRIADANGAVLSGLMLDPGVKTGLTMQFRLARDERARGKFHVDVVQQNVDEHGTERHVGGVGFEVQVISTR